jgi:hypothetical protein
MATIITRTESKRGCGFRKKGGKYFVSDGISRPCGKLPIPLTVCPCCNQGIKQSRGFTWITGALLQTSNCPTAKQLNANNPCHTCPLNYIEPNEKFGLMWVGEKYYPSTSDFTKEAAAMGVSKRISQVPKDFIIGETWICLGHPEAVVKASDTGELETQPGIFHAFQPSRIEYIVTGKESEEELDAMEKRGFTLIDVIPEEEGEEEGGGDEEE